MTKAPTTLTRRRIFRAGAALAVTATATPLLTPASVRAEDDRQAGADRLNGNGFYRFKIGDFQATVISDGYGQSVRSADPRMNVSEAELRSGVAGKLHAAVDPSHEQHVGGRHGVRERILVDTGFGEKIGHPSAAFPGPRGEPAPGWNHAGEHRSGRDVARSPRPYRRLGEKIGALTFPKATVRLCRYGVELLDRQLVRKRRSTARRCPTRSRSHDWGSAENLPPIADRCRFVKQGGEITGGVHYVAASGTFAVPCLNLVHTRARSSSCIWATSPIIR